MAGASSHLPTHQVGALRDAQGWIGGTSPLDAALVPPPPAQGGRCSVAFAPDADADRLAKKGGQRLRPVHLDVTGQGSIELAAALVGEAVGRDGLGGLVNNPGISLGGPVEYLSLDDWRLQLEVNVIGQVAVTKAFLPLLRAAGGRVVFVGSVAGRLAGPLFAPYSASKHALEAIAESLRHKLRPAGIRVILIEPGTVKTPIWDKARARVSEAEHSLPAEALDRYRKFITAGRQVHRARPSNPAGRLVDPRLSPV